MQRAADATRELGDDAGHALVLLNLGNLYFQAFDLAEARTLYDTALERHGALGDKTGQARAEIGRGHVSSWTGDLDEARARYDRAEELATSVHARDERIRARLGLATLATWEDDTTQARALYEDLLEEENPDARNDRLASLVRLGLASIEIFEGGDPEPWLAQCEPMLADLGSEAMTWLYRVVEAARDWQERPEHARTIWSQAAGYFERARFTIPAKAAHALVEIMDERSLDEVARDLANAMGRFHPLPEWVRRAETRDEAIRAIIGLVMN